MNEPTQPTQTSLSPQTLFAVLTRVLGLSYLAGTVSNVWSALVHGMSGLLGDAVGQAAVGLFLIFGTDIVLRLFYRERAQGVHGAA